MRRVRKKPQKKPQELFKVNERIKSPELKVIDDEGNFLDAMPKQKALDLARQKELDLVEINPKANPPIAKILDYGQFKYQKEKEMRKQKASQKKTDTKGVRLSSKIGKHDIDVRLNQGKKFLEQGNKLKIEIILKGREKQHTGVAIEQIKEYIDEISKEMEIKVEQPVKRQGGQVTAIIAPAK